MTFITLRLVFVLTIFFVGSSRASIASIRDYYDYYPQQSSPYYYGSVHPWFYPYYNPYLPYRYASPHLPNTAIEDEQNPINIQTRQFGGLNISSIISLLLGFNYSSLPAVTLNPNYPSLLSQYATCTANSGQTGYCMPFPLCYIIGGSPSGNCRYNLPLPLAATPLSFLNTFPSSCCILNVKQCEQKVMLNNTNWQTPSSLKSTCSMTINAGGPAVTATLQNTYRPICQVRLDFLSFNISQPNSDSVCNVDSFTVTGAANQVPTICGDNTGQHMYLTFPNATSTITMKFNFGQSTTTPNWKILFTTLPCGGRELAPTDCLQYYTSASGSIQSFNWNRQSSTTTAVRQLANQNYNICFRTELINGQPASAMHCLTPCSFSSSATDAPYVSLTGAGTTTTTSCPGADYLSGSQLIYSPVNNTYLDKGDGRVCGGVAAGSYYGFCTLATPYVWRYTTDGNENGDTANTGFCFNYQEFTTQPSVTTSG